MYPLIFPLIATALAQSPRLTVQIGKPALLFSLPSVNEEAAFELVNRGQVSLSDFAGLDPIRPSRAVVIYFFDHEKESGDLATLNGIQNRYDKRRVQVLGIDANTSILDQGTWMDKERLDFPVLRDRHGVVVGRYGVNALPLTVIVDGDGEILSIASSTGTLLESSITANLAPVLEQ